MGQQEVLGILPMVLLALLQYSGNSRDGCPVPTESTEVWLCGCWDSSEKFWEAEGSDVPL